MLSSRVAMNSLATDFETGPVGEGFEGAVHGLKKIVAVSLHVKADKVGAKEAFDELALPGTNAEGFGIGPGNMPENGDTHVGARFLDHAGEKREVVVLNEEDRRGSAGHLVKNGVGKTAVDALVEKPVFGAKEWAGMRDVTERPETLVREAFVVAAIFLLGKPDAAECVGGVMGRNLNAVVFTNDLAVGVTGTVGDPGAVAGLKNGFERGDEAAGGNDQTDGAVTFVENVHVGFAIGDDKKGVAMELGLEADAETVRGPQSGLSFAKLRFLACGGASGTEIASQMADLGVQLIEEFALGDSRGSSGRAVTKSAEPLGHFGQRGSEGPANEKKGKGDDEKSLDESVDESVAQGVLEAGLNEPGVENNDERTVDLPVVMKR